MDGPVLVFLCEAQYFVFCQHCGESHDYMYPVILYVIFYKEICRTEMDKAGRIKRMVKIGCIRS